MTSHREIFQELTNVLSDDGLPEVRAGAAKGLGDAGGAEALSALRRALARDGTAQVRGAAAVGLILGLGNPQELADQ